MERGAMGGGRGVYYYNIEYLARYMVGMVQRDMGQCRQMGIVQEGTLAGMDKWGRRGQFLYNRMSLWAPLFPDLYTGIPSYSD